MIPKIIHYCWFGSMPLPPLAVHCIESWKNYCPDYKIIRWDETNTDFLKYKYTKEAYKEKKWSFVSDVIRLESVYNHGGIYMDTDVELLKPLDSLLNEKAFISFESDKQVNSGNILAAEKNNIAVKKLLTPYIDKSFYNDDAAPNTTPSPYYNTEALVSLGLKRNNTFQRLDSITVYPSEYFCPKDLATGRLKITNNTYAIHHFDGAWLSEDSKKLNELKQKIYRHFGNGYFSVFCIFFAKNIIIRYKSILRRIKKDGTVKLFNHYLKKYILERQK